MSDEPRRSVRATKGQHKALEQEQSIEAPKRRGRKKKNEQEEKQEDTEEEVIRCVCGATEQDEDSGEPWIACDRCGVWQHNVCVGMSVFTEDLNSDYYCELCKPEDHKELLEGISRGEKPWEERRRIYEEEQAQKKKRGPKKGKGKRLSGDRDDASSQTNSRGAKPSPAPEAKKETKAPTGTKRKSRAGSSDDAEEPTPQKLRKITESQPTIVDYQPPSDIPERITELLNTRQGPAKALLKSLVHVIGAGEKKSAAAAADNATVEQRAEHLALQIERAVHDTHGSQKEYSAQIRTLAYNLKTNNELYVRLASRTLTPPMLATMSSDELASKEMQREKAEMKARADKQAILVTDDGPRVRRTHKGEEMVGDDSFAIPSDETPSVIRRPSVRESQATEPSGLLAPSEHHDDGGEEEVELPALDELAHGDGHTQTQTQTQSPKTEFDINKVFSSVKSPTAAHHRRPSLVTGPVAGPGVDPEVDRMLQDDGNDSPPYSPSEETDPDVVWRGNVVMTSIANLYATAKHVGGANLQKTLGLSWTTLLPKRLPVAGRIDPQKAIEYLCSLRYSPPTDIVVVNLIPASETAKSQFTALFEYFTAKKRYGVVGEKGLANVRDTYLVPVPAGSGDYPEFMMNLVDNFIPETRSEPMLLLVIVFRNTPDTLDQLRRQASEAAVVGTPDQRSASVAAPAFSPTSPQGAFPTGLASRGGQPLHAGIEGVSAQSGGQSFKTPEDPTRVAAQQHGEAVAREILGPLISSPTVSFLMPQAYQMRPTEWELIRRIFERDARARMDLPHLAGLIEKESPVNSDGTKALTAPIPPELPGSSGHGPAPTTAAPLHRTPIPPPVIPPQMATHAAVRKQTPIPPPPIPPQATAPPPV